MEPIFTIIKQDLEVAKRAVAEDDFNLVNIIGNRIMTNIFTTNNNEMMILGWLIKELGLELISLNQMKYDKINEIKNYSATYLNELISTVASENTESKVYWQKFFEIENKLRKSILSKNEDVVYNEQADFSKGFAVKMLDVFYSNKNMLFIENNTLPTTITSELGRSFNEHGGEEALIIYFVLRTFEDYYRYFYFEKFFIKYQCAIERSEAKLKEYVENIYKLRSVTMNGDLNGLYNESNSIVSMLGVDYRLYYMIYLDYSRTYPQEKVRAERRLELSQETKQKIGELITASLQEKLK